MPKKKSAAGSKSASHDVFTVDIRGLNLTAPARSRIERSIRRAVMKEIASIDHDGRLVVQPLRASLAPEGFSNHTAGIQLQVMDE